MGEGSRRVRRVVDVRAHRRLLLSQYHTTADADSCPSTEQRYSAMPDTCISSRISCSLASSANAVTLSQHKDLPKNCTSCMQVHVSFSLCCTC